LSRVNDTLLLSFQPAPVGASDRRPEISLDEYTAFMTAIGLHPVREAGFSPFFHEIVKVEQHPDVDAPIVVSGEYWPSLMLGNMMFSRAGVIVTSGREHIHKETAETSTMYWTFRRKTRPCYDLSVGWGSNSQWRTSFRRDYRIGRSFYFNVDGSNDLSLASPGKDRDDLTPQERLELLLHRCFIRGADPHEALFPFDDAYRITTLETD